MNRQATGAAAEQLACEYLQARGLRLLERNYRCRFGEIDLIMQDGADLVFVEVRYRRSHRFGGAALSVDAAKQAKLLATAQHYLQSKASKRNARVDVIAVEAGNRVDWIKNAIEAP